MENMADSPFKKRTADVAAAFEKIGQARGRNSQVNGSEAAVAGRAAALASPNFKLVTGERLIYRPLTGTTEVVSGGIVRTTKGEVSPAGEKFCEILRQLTGTR